MQLEIGEQARQGDVFVTRIAELPKGLTPKKTNVILEGELSGHFHKTTSGQQLVNPKTKNPLEICYVKGELETELVHDEHPTIGLGPGIFLITRQREQKDNVQGFTAIQD